MGSGDSSHFALIIGDQSHMKKTIAIVSPSPVPFVTGGIENLTWSLVDYLNRQGRGHAELIKVPSPEGDFAALIDSYERFSNLRLDHFNCVVTVKYPAWMLLHGNHAVYMAHRLRGLYDTYHFSGLPIELSGRAPPELRKLWELAQRRELDRSALPELFARSREAIAAGHENHWTALPSPLVRAVVHRLDAIGMQGVRRFLAISRTVAERQDYFPEVQPVEVAVPPSGLTPARPRRQDYLFTVSRLDGPKRIDLLIQAMRFVRGDIRLLIAGTGPQSEALQQLAKDDPRIEFLGYVGDEFLAEYYANSLAVVFVPLDEDLGLITLEAMSCGKPVITVSDAGGPTEFVEHGVTGWVAQPSPAHLAEAIQAAIEDPKRTADMGLKASDRIASTISWGRVAAAVTGETAESPTSANAAGMLRSRRILVLSTFPVFPPLGGGQARIYHLWRRISRHHDVTILALTQHGAEAEDKTIAPGLRQIVVPITAAQQAHERNISSGLDWHPASDVAFAMAPEHTPEFRHWCLKLLPATDLLVASHPYAAAAVRDLELPELWYEAHNHEQPMKKRMYGDAKGAKDAAACIEDLERWLCAQSSTILVVSDEDERSLAKQHCVPQAKFVRAPNGVDLESVHFRSQEMRGSLRRRLGLSRPMGVLLASWHGPNLEAVETLLESAPQLADVDFCVIGSAAGAFKDRKLPPNVHMLGSVSDAEKDVLLGAADVALNPMQSGGGSNLKLLDYMAAGAPVITSAFGARGTGLGEGEAWIYDAGGLVDTIRSALHCESTELNIRVSRARRLVEQRFSWDVVAATLQSRLQEQAADPATAESS